ncbi:chemotaxis protein CheB [bacterium]|nr:chemotaxis protein CheB [bacterium]MBU1874121.1 chemotaxis protein CheB [bacterium]
MGASAGGIDALKQVLERLPADLPAAVIIVQHLSPSKPTQLHEYLDKISPLRVYLAEDGAPIKDGAAYLAVPGQHLKVAEKRLVLNMDEPENYVRPAVDVLFTSAAESFGSKTVGVVLTGTGRDGARGCRQIKAKGGATIAQDEKTSRNFGMPKAAIETGAVDFVLPLEKIADKIIELVFYKRSVS